MSNEITFSREGLILTVSSVALAFIVLFLLAFNGFFCGKSKVVADSKPVEKQVGKVVVEPEQPKPEMSHTFYSRLPPIPESDIETVLSEQNGRREITRKSVRGLWLIDDKNRPTTGVNIVTSPDGTIHVQQFKNGELDGLNITHIKSLTRIDMIKNGDVVSRYVAKANGNIEEAEYRDGKPIWETVAYPKD